MQTLKNAALLLISATLLALLAWMWQRPEPTAANPAADANQPRVQVPDVEANDVTLRQLRPDGSLHYSLQAESIRQFTDDELTRMIVPYLQLFNPEQPPWDVRAKHGYIRKTTGTNEDVVFLRETVVLHQDHPENGLITMRSEAFYVYPGRQYAETDQGVIIDTQVGRTRAAGLKANLDSGLLLLTSATTSTASANAQENRDTATQGKHRVHTIVLPEQFKNPGKTEG